VFCDLCQRVIDGVTPECSKTGVEERQEHIDFMFCVPSRTVTGEDEEVPNACVVGGGYNWACESWLLIVDAIRSVKSER
jgi:hypothetical protein